MTAMPIKSITGYLALTLFLSLFFGFAANPAEAEHMSPVKVKVQQLSEGIFYPVVTSGIPKRSVLEKINQTLHSHAREVLKADIKYKKQYAQVHLISAADPYYASTRPFVRYNNGQMLSISFIDEAYTGGAHGMHYEKVYNFNILSGKEYRLNEIIKDKKELQKVNTFVKKQMIDLKDRGRYDFFVDAFKSMDIHNGQFYFYDKGIVVIFQEYEVAPYSNGIIHMEVPYTVFK